MPGDIWDDGLDDWDDGLDDNDDEMHNACGRWDQNARGGMSAHCTQAGTEHCDWMCPYRNNPKT
jgi:hypothetical protein